MLLGAYGSKLVRAALAEHRRQRHQHDPDVAAQLGYFMVAALAIGVLRWRWIGLRAGQFCRQRLIRVRVKPLGQYSGNVPRGSASPRRR